MKIHSQIANRLPEPKQHRLPMHLTAFNVLAALAVWVQAGDWQFENESQDHIV